MKKTLTLFGASSLLLLSGCTSLSVQKDVGSADAASGVVYYLPRLDAEISITRKLVRCEVVSVLNPGSASPHDEYRIEISQQATLTPKAVPDPNARYRISYESLASITKTTSFKAELHSSGLLKSVNAGAEDQTGSIIQNVLVGAAQLALSHAGIPASAMRPASVEELTEKASIPKPLQPVCREKVVKASKALSELPDQIEALAKQVAAIEARIESKTTLKTDVAELAKKKAELEGLQQARSKAEKLLTHVQTVRLSDTDWRLLESTPLTIQPPTALLERWFRASPSDSDGESFATGKDHPLFRNYLACRSEPTSEACAIWQLPQGMVSKEEQAGKWVPTSMFPKSMNAVLSMDGAKVVSTRPKDGCSEGNGLVYRQPFYADIAMCAAVDCFAPNKDAGLRVPVERRLFSSAFNVPQLGVTACLPLKNRLFEQNNFIATFDESGALTTFEFNVQRSVLAGATKSLKDASGSVAQYREANSAEARELAKLNSEKALLDKQLAVEKARQQLAKCRDKGECGS